jgi:N-acetylmuramoyl-L-alanine amidase
VTKAIRGRRTLAGAALAVSLGGALLLAFATRGAATAPASLTVQLPPTANDRIYASPVARGRPIVVIDAGHGGRDPGARSVSGEIAEKDLTLVLARELRDDLVKRGRVRVAMTRDDDRYLTLEDRAAVARRLNAGIFVSLHMDSAPNPLARGASVYSLSTLRLTLRPPALRRSKTGAGLARTRLMGQCRRSCPIWRCGRR